MEFQLTDARRASLAVLSKLSKNGPHSGLSTAATGERIIAPSLCTDDYKSVITPAHRAAAALSVASCEKADRDLGVRS